MKCIVTGGAGFIGSHVVERLHADGHAVLVLDDFSTGNKENIPAGVPFETVSITDGKVESLIRDFAPDCVIHLAAQKNVRVSLDNPVFDTDINVLGSVSVFEAARRSGCKKIIFASSGGAVYAPTDDLPLTEDSKIAPISPYGVAKATADMYLSYYHAVHGMDYVSLRLANVFGPRQDPKGEAGVIALFFDALLHDKPVKIFGTGEQTRDFVFVEDVVDAIVAATVYSGALVCNIGTGTETSIVDLFALQKSIADSDMSADHAPAIAGELMRNVLDVSLAQKQLDWTPKHSLQSGLQKTWQWFSKN